MHVKPLSFYMDMLKANGSEGVNVDERTHDVMILLYADDMAMCSDTFERMQREKD